MSNRAIEPVSGEQYCFCKQWRRYVHVSSEHAQLARNALKQGSKAVYIAEWATREREHDD